MEESNLGRIACLRFLLSHTFCAAFIWRKKSTEITGLGCFERALKQRNPPIEILHIESYRAPLLLCSDYVPPRVLSGMLCGRPRLRRPRVPQSRPLQASTPEPVRRLFLRRKSSPSSAVRIPKCAKGSLILEKPAREGGSVTCQPRARTRGARTGSGVT